MLWCTSNHVQKGHREKQSSEQRKPRRHSKRAGKWASHEAVSGAVSHPQGTRRCDVSVPHRPRNPSQFLTIRSPAKMVSPGNMHGLFLRPALGLSPADELSKSVSSIGMLLITSARAEVLPKRWCIADMCRIGGVHCWQLNLSLPVCLHHRPHRLLLHHGTRSPLLHVLPSRLFPC